MSQNNRDDEARATRLSGWAEGLGELPETTEVLRGNGVDSGQALLEAALGSPEAVERAVGRPSLSGSTRHGHSPVRQVRLPHDLDEALIKRAAEEHRRPSEVVREALTEYLRRAS